MRSESEFLGVPVVSMVEDQWAWLTIGAGTGVLVVGAGGAGLVTFTLYGAGLLFGTGQVTAGLICMGQAGLGLVLFLGQAGTGLVWCRSGGHRRSRLGTGAPRHGRRDVHQEAQRRRQRPAEV